MMIDIIRIPFLKIQFNLDAYNFSMSFPKGKKSSKYGDDLEKVFQTQKKWKILCGNRLPKVMNGSVELQIES